MDIGKLVCPVYDTIDAVQYQRYASEENNIIHATSRRKDMDRDEFIDHAKKNLTRLVASGVLAEREKPALYIYGIMFTLCLKSSPSFRKNQGEASILLSGLYVL